MPQEPRRQSPPDAPYLTSHTIERDRTSSLTFFAHHFGRGATQLAFVLDDELELSLAFAFAPWLPEVKITRGNPSIRLETKALSEFGKGELR